MKFYWTYSTDLCRFPLFNSLCLTQIVHWEQSIPNAISFRKQITFHFRPLIYVHVLRLCWIRLLPLDCWCVITFIWISVQNKDNCWYLNLLVFNFKMNQMLCWWVFMIQSYAKYFQTLFFTFFFNKNEKYLWLQPQTEPNYSASNSHFLTQLQQNSSTIQSCFPRWHFRDRFGWTLGA